MSLSGEGHLSLSGRMGTDQAVIRLEERAEVLRSEVEAGSVDQRAVVDLLSELVEVAKAQRAEDRMMVLLTRYLALATAVAVLAAICVPVAFETDSIAATALTFVVVLAVLVGGYAWVRKRSRR